MSQPDVIVIGTGQAGVPLATALAERGHQVLIAERDAPGGTCINVGCTPTKTMIASAKAAHVARTAGRLGVRTGRVEIDFPAVVARKDKLVAEWREGVRSKLRDFGPKLTFVEGHARFVGPREIEVDGKRHRAARIVINAGGRPLIPPIPGLAETPYLDNRTAMELPALPEHLVVLGGGYIGCEFGQMFRRFGAKVTIVDGGSRLMGREDPEVSTELEKVFRAEGIELSLGSRVERVTGDRSGVAVTVEGGKKVSGSHLLVATGRKPNTDDLGVDAAGVKLDERGFIVVDDRYATSAEGVFAVGDVTGQPQFTHTAWDDHRILLAQLLGKSPRARSSRNIPYTAFTDPQVAGVGLTEGEAKRRGVRYELASMPFGYIARAIELDETAGVVRVLIDPGNDRILGASIVGAEAGELIHVFVALMEAGATARAVVDAQMIHPTFAEGLQAALMSLARYQVGN